jgi:hypothetical protein
LHCLHICALLQLANWALLAALRRGIVEEATVALNRRECPTMNGIWNIGNESGLNQRDQVGLCINGAPGCFRSVSFK